MKGPYGHKVACRAIRNHAESDKGTVVETFAPGNEVEIHNLQSAAGMRINGKRGFVLSPEDENGRFSVVLIDDLSINEINKVQNGDFAWIPNSRKKAIKKENLKHTIVTMLPISTFDD